MASSSAYQRLAVEEAQNHPGNKPNAGRFGSLNIPRGKRWAIPAVLVLVMVLIGSFHRDSIPASIKTSNWSWSLSTEVSKARVSQHNDRISVILMTGNNDFSVLDATTHILQTTVGPYDLIGVFTGSSDKETDQSMDIVDLAIKNHKSAKVDRFGKGLRSYTSLEFTDGQRDKIGLDISESLNQALRTVKQEYVVVINADEMIYEYGWDRILLTAMKSSPVLLGVSGRGAANLESETDPQIVDGLGILSTNLTSISQFDRL